jgi:hypothetical protein
MQVTRYVDGRRVVFSHDINKCREWLRKAGLVTVAGVGWTDNENLRGLIDFASAGRWMAVIYKAESEAPGTHSPDTLFETWFGALPKRAKPLHAKDEMRAAFMAGIASVTGS